MLLCDTSFPPKRVPLNVTETQHQELEQSWDTGKYAVALLVSARASNLLSTDFYIPTADILMLHSVSLANWLGETEVS